MIVGFGLELFVDVDNNEASEVVYFFEVGHRDVEQGRHYIRSATDVPNVANWDSEVDVTHTLTANRGAGNFDTTLIADNTFVTNSLVLTAVTFPVLGWSKNTLVE